MTCDPPEPFWEFWCRHVVAIWAATEVLRQRAEAAEAERDRVKRLYRAMKAGVRLPWQNAFPAA